MAIAMAFLRRHRVLVVLLGLGVLVSVLVGSRIKKQLDEGYRQSPDDLGRLFVTTAGDRPVLLLEAKFQSLYFTSLLALILVYMVLASQFRSLKDPFTIMFSVPIAVIGGLLVSMFFTLVLIPTLDVMFEERFPRTITPIEDDGAPLRREAPAQ
jgi:uncharacterized membrane protein